MSIDNVTPFPSRPPVEPEPTQMTPAIRQTQTLHALRLASTRGLTWAELGSHLGLHHGAASAVLSRLHQQGRIVRLQTSRRRSRVYVLPEFVDGRMTSPRRPHREPFFEEAIHILAGLSCPDHEAYDSWCPSCVRAREASRLLRRWYRQGT